MDIPDLSNDSKYLTILRDAQTNLQVANLKKGQKPSIRTPRAQLERDQIIYQYKPSAGNEGKFQLQISYISHKYPPSITPLSALKKTYIDDLLLETNHRGTYVLLRAMGPPSKMGAVMNAVDDERGGCDLIQLYNMDLKRDPRTILPKGQILIVKEPFYKANTTSGTSIRVDHVSDVIFLSADDPRIPLKWQPPRVKKVATDWKEEGNTFFKNHEFYKAIECYTKGLEAPEDIAKVLRLNRSLASLSAGLLDKAIEDSDYILESDPKNEKALFRGAKAFYLSRKFEDCKSRATTCVKIYPGNKEVKELLLKANQRLQEEQTGKYNFEQMRALTSGRYGRKGPVKLDCADFVGPVQLQDAEGSGRGLFATRDVKFGELLLCTKAFHVCYPETDGRSVIMDLTTGRIQMSSGSQLNTEVIQKLYNNPSASKEYLQLFSGTYQRVEGNEVDGKPVVDTFLAHTIRDLNSFGCPVPSSAENQSDSNTGGCGIWIMPSFINHACQGAGSARRSFIGDMMIVRAAKDIKEGEEITHSYCKLDDVDVRRKSLQSVYGFLCNCSLCTVESTETPAIRYSRQTQLTRILKLNPAGQIYTDFLQKYLQLIKSLEDTYTKPTTEQPRYTVFYALKHLSKISPGGPDETLERFQRILEALGYQLGESQGKSFIARHGAFHPLLPEIFNQSASAYASLGVFSMAKSYNELAACFWEVAFGEKDGFYNKYPEK